MQFKDLSYWGIFKLSIVFEAAIPIISSPFLLIYYLLKPEAFNFKFDNQIFGITVNVDNLVIAAIMIVILTLMTLIIQSAIWYVLAKKTPLGRVRISNMVPPDTIFD